MGKKITLEVAGKILRAELNDIINGSCAIFKNL